MVKNATIKVCLLILKVVLFCRCEKGQNTNISVEISDDIFLMLLIQSGVDTNGDDEISYAEAQAVNKLNISSTCGILPIGCEGIESLDGIEAFINLDTLQCSSNVISDLDLSQNTSLKFLDCENNNLTSLNILKNTKLEYLYCRENQLSSLDVSKNTSLLELYCSDNKLNNLDIKNNTALTGLFLYNNQLTSIDLSNNTSLSRLFIGAMNEFTTLDLSANSTIKWLYINNMPNLTKVCIWEMPFPPNSVTTDTSGCPNINFTTECS